MGISENSGLLLVGGVGVLHTAVPTAGLHLGYRDTAVLPGAQEYRLCALLELSAQRGIPTPP